MTTLTLMMVIWAVMVVALVILLIYRGHLTEHETDQLYLTEETPSALHQENDAIVRRVKMIQPICTGVGSLTLLMTLAIAGLWVVQKLQ
jgi:hypothetical protein